MQADSTPGHTILRHSHAIGASQDMLKKMAAASGRRSGDSDELNITKSPRSDSPSPLPSSSSPTRPLSPSHPNPRNMSHGRGGAGNINPSAGGVPDPKDLTTPTIKSATYTTGRGGSGNMARNDSSRPDVARRAQDVEPPPHHDKPPQGTFHWGRGGEGNQITVGKSGAEEARERSRSRPKQERRTGSFGAAVNKGREILNLGKGKEGKGEKEGKNEKSDSPVEESAIADD